MDRLLEKTPKILLGAIVLGFLSSSTFFTVVLGSELLSSTIGSVLNTLLYYSFLVAEIIGLGLVLFLLFNNEQPYQIYAAGTAILLLWQFVFDLQFLPQDSITSIVATTFFALASLYWVGKDEWALTAQAAAFAFEALVLLFLALLDVTLPPTVIIFTSIVSLLPLVASYFVARELVFNWQEEAGQATTDHNDYFATHQRISDDQTGSDKTEPDTEDNDQEPEMIH